jgi:hypothetical protein
MNEMYLAKVRGAQRNRGTPSTTSGNCRCMSVTALLYFRNSGGLSLAALGLLVYEEDEGGICR